MHSVDFQNFGLVARVVENGWGVRRGFADGGMVYAACSFGLPSSLTRRKSDDHEAPRRFAARFSACDAPLQTYPRTSGFPWALWSTSTHFVLQIARGISQDGATIFFVALRGPPASFVLKNPWPDSHAGDERRDTGQPRNDRAQCPEWSHTA
jgi:hypothetical protein